MKEEELIKKFYSDQSTIQENNDEAKPKMPRVNKWKFDPTPII